MSTSPFQPVRPVRHVRREATTATVLPAIRVAAWTSPPRSRSGPLMLLSLGLVTLVALVALTASSATAQDWRIERIGQGTKPALGLTPDGAPIIISMLERQDGWVRVSSLEDGEWQTDEVATGYFYGPPDITVGADGIVHAAYHDHQGQEFNPEKGDAVYLRRADGAWTAETAEDPGHDGWDTRITTDASGRPHMAAVDPVDFGGSGIEYYGRNEDGSWAVEAIGSGPQTYKYAVSVVVDDDGVPWISYHDGSTKTLNLAHRDEDGWQIETVDADGETGFFSELALDADGGLHVSYYERTGETSGVVRHAYRGDPDGEWQRTVVDQLDAVATGFTGARNITSIDIDPEGDPWIAYSDERTMKLAQLVGGEWQIEKITEAADAPLGQIVSLELDAEGHPHVAFADVTDKSQLDGSIWYATR